MANSEMAFKSLYASDSGQQLRRQVLAEASKIGE